VGSHPELNTAWIEAQLTKNLDVPGVEAKNSGDAARAISEADQGLSQTYQLPYLSHAQVEPLNCTAHVERERCRIWIPTQGQTHTQKTAVHLTGLPEEKVEVMTLPAGGGFGLRGEQDEVIDAVLLSKALHRPVKVVCSREDEFIHGCFRPANHSRVEAGLNKQGQIIGWKHKVSAPSVMSRLMPHAVKNGLDPDAVNGLVDMVYTLDNHAVEYVMAKLPVPVGWWRSVGYSTNTFVVESFMDELAQAAGKDPVAFRLEHMEKAGRAAGVLTLLANKTGWGQPVPQGRARGVAVAHCFESFAAHMAEVSVDKQGKVTVHKVVCALDCGTAIFPDAIRIQAEAGVIMALSTAFHEKMHFDQGGVATSNYSDYPLLSMSEVPEIEVHIAHNYLKAGGVGEPVFPSVAPAVANAIFSATGVRLRELPFRREQLVKS
jgi:isoquinoline 1-oxidoreductase beta subunit